jgi:hypothetical protein
MACGIGKGDHEAFDLNFAHLAFNPLQEYSFNSILAFAMPRGS